MIGGWSVGSPVRNSAAATGAGPAGYLLSVPGLRLLLMPGVH